MVDAPPHVPGQASALIDDVVRLPEGPELAVRRATGPLRPFLLVHGLASNARMWDGVAERLAAAGHEVVSVDLRGHGRSAAPDTGYDTDTCADDLAALVATQRLTGGRAPVAVGQSWGGNVVLSLAARRAAVAAVACVDGGWLRPAQWFADAEQCWQVLAPPDLSAARYDDVASAITARMADWPPGSAEAVLANLEQLPGGGIRNRLAREHHRGIVLSMYHGDPRMWYPLVDVPVLLCPAGPGAQSEPVAAAAGDGTSRQHARSQRLALAEAVAGLRDVTVSRYPDAHHDLHLQFPARLAGDLLALAARAEPDVARRSGA